MRVREFTAEDWRIAFHSLSGKSESNTWNRAHHQFLQPRAWKTAIYKVIVYYKDEKIISERIVENFDAMLLIKVIIVIA